MLILVNKTYIIIFDLHKHIPLSQFNAIMWNTNGQFHTLYSENKVLIYFSNTDVVYTIGTFSQH